MAFAEALTAFFDTDDFASEATVDGADVVGIFDNGYVEAADGAATRQPTFTLATLDVPLSPVGKALVHAGITYSIAHHEPDGTGVSVLFLARTT